MKGNKFVKSIINVVFTMVLMLNMMMIVGAYSPDSISGVKRTTRITDGVIQTPIIKYDDNKYVICVDPSLDAPFEPATCTKTSSYFTTKDEYKVGAALDKLANSSKRDCDFVGAYVAINVYLYSQHGSSYYARSVPPITAGDSLISCHSKMEEYQSVINSAPSSTPSGPDASIDVSSLTFNSNGSEYVSNSFDYKGVLSVDVSPKVDYEKTCSSESSNSGTLCQIRISKSDVDSTTTVTIRVSNSKSYPYAKKYNCGDGIQPVAALFTETLENRDSASGKIEPYTPPTPHEPEKGKIKIVKQDSKSGKELSGGRFVLYTSANCEGSTISVGGNNPFEIDGSITITNLTLDHVYSIAEVVAPAGYKMPSDRCVLKSIKVSSSSSIPSYNITNDLQETLSILKVDEKGVALPGARLQLLDSNKSTVLDEWDSTGAAHQITKVTVTAGKKYYVKEISAPEGYLVNQTLMEVVLTAGETKTVKFTNSKNSILIRKVDADDKTKSVVGATLHIEDSKGKKIGESWVTTATDHSIEKLEPGTYYLVEDKAPDGYQRNTDKIKFVVTGNETTVIQVTMPNKKSEVSISKVDATTKKELPGAKLQLTNAKGEVVETWESTDKPHVIKGLKDGKYSLTETLAPEGYVLSTKTVEFEVKNGKVDKPVVMENELTPVPSTGGSRSVLLLFVAMLDIALGIGIITYVKKNRMQN